MAKTSKATKKFNKKHLKKTLEKRNKAKEYKRRIGNKKALREEKAKNRANGRSAKDGEVFDDMDLEKYFEKKVEVPSDKTKKRSKLGKKSKEEEKSKGEESELEIESESDSKAGSDAESDSEAEMEMDKQDLEDLKKEDPEFYKYLKDNDKDLLDFNPVNPMDMVSSDEDDEDKEEAEREKKDKDKEKTQLEVEVTIEMVKSWEKNMMQEKPSIKGIKQAAMAFKAAVNSETDREYRYKVSSGPVFNLLMMVVLKKLPLAIERLSPYKKDARGSRKLGSTSKKLNGRICTIVKLHSTSLLELLDGISKTEMAILVLQSTQELFPYIMSWRKILKILINSVVQVWASSGDFETQVAAFAFLNNVSHEYPKAVLEISLRSMYSGFVKNCRRTNVHTIPSINFQKNSMAELYGEDESLGYRVGFENIRQLAIHLRESVDNPTKESYKAVYNWQVCNALDFWSRMLCLRCNPEAELKSSVKKGRKSGTESPLRQLIYPLVQVTIGTIRLVPSAQFFPLRFYLVRSLIRLSQATGVFIPLFPLISEILTSSVFTKKPRASSLAAVDFDSCIKVNKAYIGTRVYQSGVCDEFIELCAEFFALYCKSIAFPELITPPVIYLRRFRKRKGGNLKFSKQLGTLIDKLNANAKYIESRRATVQYGPSNTQEVSKFLQDVEWEKTPLGAYVKTQREVKEAKMKILRDSLEKEEEEERKREQEKGEGEEEREGDEDASEDDEDGNEDVDMDSDEE